MRTGSFSHRAAASSSAAGPLCRGYFDRVHRDDGSLVLAGWLLVLGRAADRVVVRLDGRVLGEAARVPFDGVASLYPDEPDARRAGFYFVAAAPPMDHGRWSRIEVDPIVGGRMVEGLSILHRPGWWADLPVPPEPLRIRVTGHGSVDYYRLGALQTLSDLLPALDESIGLGARPRVLDWGCGSGRVTGLLLAHWPEADVVGCDIDAEAIAWCDAHLAAGRFVECPRRPPTRLDAESFDVVIGFSVLTHLTRDRQAAWLAEIARLLRPGGRFLATVSGEFAALPPCPPAVRDDLARDGISDGFVDPALEDVAPPGYYRAVYQTEAYTRRAFEPFFEVLDYVPRAMSRFQDLVIARKPG